MKKILFIAPNYHGYGEMIYNELCIKGYEVFWINQSIQETDFFLGYVYKYLPVAQKCISFRYYGRNLENIPREIDIVLVIKAQTLTPEIIEDMKRRYPDSRFIMYQWDSVSNERNAVIVEKYFDKKLTFDCADSKKYGWVYRPLFFKEDYIEEGKRDIDISMVATIHSERVKIMQQARALCEKRGYSSYFFLQCTGLGFVKRKYINRDPVFIGAKRSDVSFTELPIRDAYAIYGRSKVVIDYTNPAQTGFTMRTIECIGTKCKLMTNNKEVLKSDFYNEENIFVYDDDISEVPEDFVRRPYVENNEVYKRYMLSSWIEEVLS